VCEEHASWFDACDATMGSIVQQMQATQTMFGLFKAGPMPSFEEIP